MPRPSLRPAARRARWAVPGAVGGALLLVAGCSSPVAVRAAPYATDPLCAAVVLALPQDLGGLERLEAGGQATAAWGDRLDPVLLRCGVETLGPTTDQCVTAEDGTTRVDWVAVPGEEDEVGGVAWRFTTYGRVPAVEVLVPASVTSTRSTSFLLDLGPAISRIEQTRECL